MLDMIDDGETRHLATLARMLRDRSYAFTTPTPATIARVNARPGNGWAADLRGVLGWSRPFRPDIMEPAMFDVMREAGMLEAVEGGWRSRLRASTLDGLPFFHSAFPTTAADSVFFGPDTYRFARAIEGVLDRPVSRAVDIGCGAGPGAVLVARAHPGAEVFGADINPSALRLTRANAAVAGVAVQAVESDLLSAIPGRFDLIVANPPYMADPMARAYRDGGGPLGASLSHKILETAIERLAPGGMLLLYTGAAVVNGADPFRIAAEARLAGPASIGAIARSIPTCSGRSSRKRPTPKPIASRPSS